MVSKKLKYAPKKVFRQILKWSVMPTFDLVIEYENQGVIFVKRKIPPYKNQWAFPGLRMMKGESIDDTLKRVAFQEVGLKIDAKKRIFLGQYVGKFKSEGERQDISTGYLVRVKHGQKILLNQEHFSDYRIVKRVPSPVGAMYKFYLKEYKKRYGK